jgi:hypothetical protein
MVDLLHHADELDTAIQVAVTGLRAFGYSWAEISSRLGATRQAAQQRWGTPTPNPRPRITLNASDVDTAGWWQARPPPILSGEAPLQAGT